MKKKLLITGGSGLLGSNAARMAAQEFEVYATFKSRASQVPGCSFVPLEIRDRQQVRAAMRRLQPNLVLHAAALVNVDYCEDHTEEAWAINVVGTENVAAAARESGARLIFISTDSVFDGEKGMYVEQDVPHPLTVYGRTKLEAEKRVGDLLPDSLVLRTAFYGWSLHKRDSLAEWFVNGLRGGQQRKGFTDIFFSPILAQNLLEVAIDLYRQGLKGLFHVGGPERCSKYDFGREIAVAFGFDTRAIQPSSFAQAESRPRAPRPRDVSLDVARVKQSTGIRLLGVAEGIACFRALEPAAKESVT